MKHWPSPFYGWGKRLSRAPRPHPVLDDIHAHGGCVFKNHNYSEFMLNAFIAFILALKIKHYS